MCERAATAFLQRQARLRALQRLNLTFLVDAQQQCLVRRVQVQADDVGEFVDELGITGNLEGLDAMRLETMGVPDALHGRRRDALRAGHGAATPMSRVDGLCVQRGVDDRADFLSADRGFAAASGTHPS